MINEKWEPGTLFLRHFDKEGRSHVEEHNCWNVSRFAESAQRAAIDAGGRTERITEDQYRKERKK